jgi:hypothetical protein
MTALSGTRFIIYGQHRCAAFSLLFFFLTLCFLWNKGPEQSRLLAPSGALSCSLQWNECMFQCMVRPLSVPST